jgi:hypothetical protein
VATPPARIPRRDTGKNSSSMMSLALPAKAQRPSAGFGASYEWLSTFSRRRVCLGVRHSSTG